MPRQTRFRAAGLTQLVLQRGHNNGPVFCDDNDYRIYLEYLKESAEETGCAGHAYGLMSNHILVLCTPRRADGVSKMMQAIGRRYAYAFNQTHHRSGSLWDGRYKACLVEPSRYVLSSYRFVETQPIRTGSVVEPQSYQWSSCRAHVSGESSRMVLDHWVYLNLGTQPNERARAYRDIFRFPLSQPSLNEIQHALSHSLVLGSERFKDDIEQKLSARVRLGQPGRPKKDSVLPYASSGATA